MAPSQKKGSSDAEKPLVFISGSTGYVGSWIAAECLASGFRVRLSTRLLDYKKEVGAFDFLDSFCKSRDSIELVELDLADPQNEFVRVMKGCDFVLHVATTTALKSSNPHRDIVQPAVDGSVKMFRAAVACKVKKFIFTSSFYAVTERFDPNHTYNESDWNEECTIDREPYSYAKTLAEKSLYNEVENLKSKNAVHAQHIPELCTMAVGMVIGPLLNIAGRTETTSIEVFREMLVGNMIMTPRFVFTPIDVRDVARAHVAAIENENAKGRYVLTSSSGVRVSHMAAILEKEFRREYGYRIPSFQFPNWFSLNVLPRVDHRLSRALFENNLDSEIHIDNSKLKKELLNREDLIDWRLGVIDSGLSLTQLLSPRGVLKDRRPFARTTKRNLHLCRSQMKDIPSFKPWSDVTDKSLSVSGDFAFRLMLAACGTFLLFVSTIFYLLRY